MFLHIIHVFHFFMRFVWHSFLIRLCDYLSPFIDNAKHIIRPNKIHAYIECGPCLSSPLSLPLTLCMCLCRSSRFLCTRSNHICFSFFLSPPPTSLLLQAKRNFRLFVLPFIEPFFIIRFYFGITGGGTRLHKSIVVVVATAASAAAVWTKIS